MTGEQLEEWKAVYEIEPWGGIKSDMQMARIVWAILGQWVPAEKMPTMDQLRCTLRDMRKPTEPMSDEEIKRKIEGLAKAWERS